MAVADWRGWRRWQLSSGGSTVAKTAAAWQRWRWQQPDSGGCGGSLAAAAAAWGQPQHQHACGSQLGSGGSSLAQRGISGGSSGAGSAAAAQRQQWLLGGSSGGGGGNAVTARQRQAAQKQRGCVVGAGEAAIAATG